MPNVTVYVMTVWQNLPSKSTALEATNLNHIEQGIKNVTDFINTLNTTAGVYLSGAPFTQELLNKLNGIEAQANKYVLPTASDAILGGVKVDGTTITIDNNGVIHGSAAAVTLESLTDINLYDLQDGQILKYDAATKKWVNTSEAEVRTQLSLLEDVDIDDETLEDGQVLKYNGTTEKWENGESGDVLGYDETLEVLGDVPDEVSSGYKKVLVYDSGSDTTYAPVSASYDNLNVDVSFNQDISKFDQLMVVFSTVNDGNYTMSGRLAFFDVDLLLTTNKSYDYSDYKERWFKFKVKDSTTFAYFSSVANENFEGYRPRIYKIYGIKY